MQVSVETTQGLERRLTITVPAAAISTEVDKELRNIAKNRRVDGFRPGKAPVAMIKKMFGLSVLQDVASRQMQNHFYQAIIANKLTPAGAPTFAPGQLAQGKDLEFKATFEVYPEVEVKNLDKIEVNKPVVEIADADLDKMLDTLRKQHAKWEEKKGKAATGDRVIIDFVGSIDGEEFEGGKATNFTLELGQGRMIPGFEDGITGKKAGEQFTIDVTFPAEYHAENLKGKAAQFAITLNSVETQVLPEVNEEFVKLFGLGENSVDALHTEVRKNMERELRQAIKSKVKNQVMDGLLAANPIEVPKALLENEVNRLRVQAVQQFGGNIKPEQLPVELFEEQAKRRVVLGLIVAEVVKQFELKPDDAKVREMIEEMASAYQEPEQVIAWYYKNDQQLNEVRSVVLEEQVVDTVLQKATVTDKSVSYEEAVKPAEAPAAAE